MATPAGPDLSTAEGIRQYAEGLRAQVAEVDPSVGRVADDVTMERVRDLEARSTALGARVDEWVESRPEVAQARQVLDKELDRLTDWESRVATASRDMGMAQAQVDAARRDYFTAQTLADKRDAIARQEAAQGRYDASAEYQRYAVQHRDEQMGFTADAAQRVGEARLEAFARLRPMGGDLEVSGTKGQALPKRQREAMADTARFFPSDWVEASNRLGDRLHVRASTTRAHYQNYGGQGPFITGTTTWKRQVPLPEEWDSRRPIHGRTGYMHTFPEGTPKEVLDRFPSATRSGVAPVEFVRADRTVSVPVSYDAYKASRRRGASPAPGATYRVLDEGGELTEFGRADGWTAVTLPDGTRGAVRDWYRHQTVMSQKGATMTSSFTTSTATNTTIHELTHRMEHANPRLGLMERAYLTRRAGVDPRQAKLVHVGGDLDEKGVAGAGMYTAYSAKVYQGEDTFWEVSSTGTPLVWGRMKRPEVARGKHVSYWSPSEAKGLEDSDHRAFVYGTMLTI